METLLRLQINILCILFLLVALSSVKRSGGKRKADDHLDITLYRLFAAAVIVLLATDAFTWLWDGAGGAGIRLGLTAATALYYAFQGLPASFYILYADYQLNRSAVRLRRRLRLLLPLNLLIFAAAAASPATGLLFRIDEAGRYSRGGAGFYVYAAVLLVLAFFSFLPVVAGRGKTSLRIYLTLLGYPIPTIIAGVVQVLFYGLILIWPAATIFLVAAALNIQKTRSSIDHLTGTVNRRSLDDILSRLIAETSQGRPFGALLTDLDEFKSINDLHGHGTGDRALEEAANILKASVRRDDTVCRLGGDEFVLLVQGADEAALAEVAARIRTGAEVHGAHDGRPYRIAFSIGSALYDPALDGDAARFLSRLDAAMYRDKAARRAARRTGAS